MAAQQVQFAETIRAMKLAMKRRADDSDSDTPLHAPTNRGQKLKRGAKYMREGRLDTTGGLAYRKKVHHAGYTRYTISTNPPLYDEDGDVYSPFDSDAEARAASPMKEDPFGEVQLEHLLRPLTAASELPEHPSLSVAYKSKALTRMADEALEMVRREKACLWKAKRLLQRFRGDADWVPCEVFETEHDEMMLLPGGESESVVVEQMSVPEMEMGEEGGVRQQRESVVVVDALDGVDAADMVVQQAIEARERAAKDAEAQAPGRVAVELEKNNPDTNGDIVAATDNPETAQAADKDPEAASERTSGSGKEANPPSHAMTTRARARSPVPSRSPSPTPSDSASVPDINTWYLIPSASLPDRDLGIPVTEAEETRRLLVLYVQKQEQIVRSLTSLYSGLARVDRQRREVFRACKAEGHMRVDDKGNMATAMSDGEDWYDPEDWGLTRADMKVQRDGTWGLEKGKEEVDDALEEEGRRGGRRRRVNRM